MNQNHCEHIHPDGSGCQAHPQTGKSYCFFHDPKQEKNRARAQRNGGFRRGRLPRPAAGYIESEPGPNPLAALNLVVTQIKTTRDTALLQEQAILKAMQGEVDLRSAACFGYLVDKLFHNLKYNEEKERRAAERAAAKAAREAAECQGTALAVPKGSEREEEFLAAAGQRGAQRSEIKEEPIVIDASQPFDPRQFGGKKPRYTSLVPVFTSIVTGKPINFDEPSPLDPPAHLLREPYRSTVPGTAPFGNPKPEAPKPPAAPAETTRKDATPQSDTRKDETKVGTPVETNVGTRVDTKVESLPLRNPNNPYTINSLDAYDTTRNRPTTYEMSAPATPSFAPAAARQPEPPRPTSRSPEEPPSPRDPSQWVLHPAYKIMKGIK